MCLIVIVLLVGCIPPPTVPLPSPPTTRTPRAESWFQPIDAGVREYLADPHNPRSPEALDALARELAEKYRKNLELEREEMARTKEMPDLTDEEKELLNFIFVREHIHKVLQEMELRKLRDKPRVTIVIKQTVVVITPPATP